MLNLHLVAKSIDTRQDSSNIDTVVANYKSPSTILTHCIQPTVYDIYVNVTELQEESPIINWSNEITHDLHSRLYPLWNRTAGDCLLDSALQATWGVVDRENTLRQALSDSLSNGSSK